MDEADMKTLYEARLEQTYGMLESIRESLNENGSRYHAKKFPAIRYQFEYVDGSIVEGAYSHRSPEELFTSALNEARGLDSKTGLEIMVPKRFVLGLTTTAFYGMLSIHVAQYYTMRQYVEQFIDIEKEVEASVFAIEKLDTDIVPYVVERFKIGMEGRPMTEFLKYVEKLRFWCPIEADRILKQTLSGLPDDYETEMIDEDFYDF